MKAFGEYADKLRRLLKTVKDGNLGSCAADVIAALDGQPSAELRRLVNLQDLRASGAFFSGSDMAARLLGSMEDTLRPNCFITDPACGAGDLLLECAKRLPTRPTLRETLTLWGKALCGSDIHKEFVAVTRLRLALLAIQRRVPADLLSASELEEIFPHIKVRDGLQCLKEIHRSTHVVMNPPFAPRSAPTNCQWASGLINSSSVFLETVIQNAKAGARLFAILPDVLRSGTRYAQLRTIVSQRCIPQRLRLAGQFDKTADVDIFFFEAKIGEMGTSQPYRWEWPSGSRDDANTVGDFFDIRVGPLVPFRHRQDGPYHLYVTTYNATAWEVISHVTERRRFSGTVFEPPLVVVRRTSRKDDRFRAVGTIMNTNRSLAVENHLLVLMPKNGSLARCKKLLRYLQRPETSAWFNNRICCRHLTVSSLASLPFDGK